MAHTKPKPKPYAEAAKYVHRPGWICVTCNRFYQGSGGERAARYCCSGDTMPCGECGKPVGCKSYTMCDDCRRQKDHERYLQKPLAEWDGEQGTEINDHFFWDMEGVEEYIAEAENAGEDFQLTQELVEQYEVTLCEPRRPRAWFLTEAFSDYLPTEDDIDPPGNWQAAEKAVNDYLDTCGPWSWIPGKQRLKLSFVSKEESCPTTT